MKTSDREVSEQETATNVEKQVMSNPMPQTLSPKRTSQNRWVIWGGSAIALALLGLGAFRLFAAQVGEPEPDPAALEEALPQRVEVVALGRIEPQGEVLRIGGPSGERIAELDRSPALCGGGRGAVWHGFGGRFSHRKCRSVSQLEGRETTSCTAGIEVLARSR